MNNNLKKYVKLVTFLGETLGPSFEAILFDVTAFEYPVLASANIRDSSTEKARVFVRQAMDSERVREKGYFTNHAVQIDLTKLSKMSVFFITDDTDEIIGALCLCMRCDVFLKMETIINGFLNWNMEDINGEPQQEELFTVISREPSLDGISEYIRSFGIEPGRTNQNEKMEIICDLYDMGVFNLKGAVAKTAEELQISTKSVYRYLSKIKEARE